MNSSSPPSPLSQAATVVAGAVSGICSYVTLLDSTIAANPSLAPLATLVRTDAPGAVFLADRALRKVVDAVETCPNATAEQKLLITNLMRVVGGRDRGLVDGWKWLLAGVLAVVAAGTAYWLGTGRARFPLGFVLGLTLPPAFAYGIYLLVRGIPVYRALHPEKPGTK